MAKPEKKLRKVITVTLVAFICLMMILNTILMF